jgi:hypothetical protein
MPPEIITAEELDKLRREEAIATLHSHAKTLLAERNQYFECAQGTRCFTCKSAERDGLASTCSSAWHLARTTNDWQENLNSLRESLRAAEKERDRLEAALSYVVKTGIYTACAEGHADAVDHARMELYTPDYIRRLNEKNKK